MIFGYDVVGLVCLGMLILIALAVIRNFFVQGKPLMSRAETIARLLTARKMELAEDTAGAKLPNDLWLQNLARARIIADIEEAKNRLDGSIWPESIWRLEQIIKRMLNGELLK